MPRIKGKLIRNKRHQALLKSGGSEDVMGCDALRNKAFDMMINEHKAIPTIAKEMGVDRTTAWGWINHIHEKTLAGISEKAALVRDRQNVQYDQLIEKWMPLALADGLEVGGWKKKRNGEEEFITLDDWDAGTKAADIVMRAMAGKARNNGLYTVHVTPKQAPSDAMGQLMDMVLPALKRITIGVEPKQAVEAVIVG